MGACSAVHPESLALPVAIINVEGETSDRHQEKHTAGASKLEEVLFGCFFFLIGCLTGLRRRPTSIVLPLS